ncbi:DUF6454 family protein [Mangrovicella endophytica]|uniref:DUF6454 family protein n=1 Tax=Mangrovicella endophytica TaxID=2066697 RepID=UPI000C9E32E7|nr:DUF6454 family protein [Mangrovicella endophytica]
MKLSVAGCVAALALVASVAPAAALDPSVGDRVTTLTRGTKWKPVRQTAIDFPTFHPQGMVKIGDDLFVSSVEITKPTTRYDTPRDGLDRDAGEGQGHLFQIGPDGQLKNDLRLGEGSIYHPGGIDYDGRYLWVPVAEYRPNSRSIIYRVDPKTMQAEEMFRFADHVGGLVHDTDAKTLHGVSWGSRRFYAWPLDENERPANPDADPSKLRVMNPSQYIDYQDCKYAGSSRMLCAGLNAYKTAPDAAPFRLGGMELVDLKESRPVWQVPVELWAPSGLPMTQNPFFVEATEKGLRAYFMPDDDRSTLFVFETEAP